MVNNINRIIINTVGASAYTNLNYKDEFQGIYNELKALSTTDAGEDKGKKATEILLNLMRDNYNNPKSRILAAEYTSLEILKVDKTQDLLYFIIGSRSDRKTDIGTACGKALCEYYDELGYTVAEPQLVPDFIIDHTLPHKPFVNPMRFLEKLEALVNELRRNHPGVLISINLTGGYKLNGIYSALVGLRYGCEIFYVQEVMGTAYGLPVFQPDILTLKPEIDKQTYDRLEERHQRWYQPTGDEYSLLTLADVVRKLADIEGASWQNPTVTNNNYYSVAQGAFVQIPQGGNVNMSNNPSFSNINITGNSGNINIGSTLTNVQQVIGASSQVPDDDKKKLTDLVEQLKAALAEASVKNPAESAEVADSLDELVKEAEKPKKDDQIFQKRGENLKKAAENLAGVVPNVLTIVGMILPIFNIHL